MIDISVMFNIFQETMKLSDCFPNLRFASPHFVLDVPP